MTNPYEDDSGEKIMYDEERIVAMLRDMAENGGLKCTECGEYLFENAETVDEGVHRVFAVYVEEGEYGHPDEIHILCNKCAKEFKWL